MTETWLELMPTIPLVRGVPVFDTRDYTTGRQRRGVVTGPQRSGELRVVWEGQGYSVPLSCHERVDLDDKQGFTYAIHYIGALGARDTLLRHIQLAHMHIRSSDVCGYLLSLLLGEEPTDADRVAVARALRGVAQ